MSQWMPLALLALHKFVAGQRIRHAIGVALGGVAQLYSSMYFAAFFFLYLIPVGGVLWLLNGVSGRRLWRGAAVAAILGVLLAIPIARPYFAAQARRGERDVLAVTVYSATFQDYVSAHQRSATWYGLLPHPEPERALFPGAMSLSLAVVGLIPPLGPIRLAYTAGMFVAFEGSRGFHGFLYPYLYNWFGPIRGMRVAARFSMLVGMTLAILAGFGMVRLLAWTRTRTASWMVFSIVLGAIVVDLRPTIDLAPVWKQPPAVYAAVAGKPGVVLAEFPWWSDGDYGPQMPPMYFSLWHWSNMVNGSSGFEPPHYQEFLEAIHLFPDSRAVDALKARGVTHVTINCALYGQDRDCHGVLKQLDDSDRFREVSTARWNGDIVKLYALVK
jgi:hypothetical protein